MNTKYYNSEKEAQEALDNAKSDVDQKTYYHGKGEVYALTEKNQLAPKFGPVAKWTYSLGVARRTYSFM